MTNNTEKKTEMTPDGRVMLPASAKHRGESVPVTVRRYAMTRDRRDKWIVSNQQNTEHLEVRSDVSAERLALQMKIRKKRKLIGFLIAAVFGILILTGVLMLISSLFVVRTVTVQGTDRCTASELSAVAGFAEGTRLRTLSAADAESRILQAHPEFESCTVETDLGGNVVIQVTEYVPALYVSLGGRYYALTENLYVTESAADAETFRSRGLLFADLPGVALVLEGKEVELLSGTVDFITEFLQAAKKAGVLEGLAKISFENRYSIIAYAENGSTTRYGSVEDIGRKLLIVERLQEQNAGADTVLRIDVSVPDAVLVDTEN